jgi:hypothetical protein
VELYIDRGKPKNSEKSCSSATLSITNPIWIDPGAKPGLRGEKPATNDLSHGTALPADYISTEVPKLWGAPGGATDSLGRELFVRGTYLF